jgi:hypothetical protein
MSPSLWIGSIAPICRNAIMITTTNTINNHYPLCSPVRDAGPRLRLARSSGRPATGLSAAALVAPRTSWPPRQSTSFPLCLPDSKSLGGGTNGKGGPYGTQSKRRIIPLTSRVQPLIEGHLALQETFGMSDRTIQRLYYESRQSRGNQPQGEPSPTLNLSRARTPTRKKKLRRSPQPRHANS